MVGASSRCGDVGSDLGQIERLEENRPHDTAVDLTEDACVGTCHGDDFRPPRIVFQVSDDLQAADLWQSEVEEDDRVLFLPDVLDRRFTVVNRVGGQAVPGELLNESVSEIQIVFDNQNGHACPFLFVVGPKDVHCSQIAAETQALAHALHKVECLGRTKHRLLIVDDDQPIRNLLRRLAIRAGFDVDVAKDGRDAIDKLVDGGKYEIVIVDLMMPRVSGYELIEHINTLQPRPTVIVATAMMNGDIAKIDDSLIRRVIKKPFDVDAVVRALVELAAEISAGRPVGNLPPEVKEVIPGDAKTHADAAAQHAAAAAAHAAAAAGEAAAAAGEAAAASDASTPSNDQPGKENHEKSAS